MSPKLAMTLSATVFGLMGVACLFLPLEVASAAGLTAGELPVQLLSSGLLAVAMLNWTGRTAVYGGIYGRPIVVANFAFGVIVAGNLISALLDGQVELWAVGMTGVFGAHALYFYVLMRSNPRGDAAERRPTSN